MLSVGKGKNKGNHISRRKNEGGIMKKILKSKYKSQQLKIVANGSIHLG